MERNEWLIFIEADHEGCMNRFRNPQGTCMLCDYHGDNPEVFQRCIYENCPIKVEDKK